MINHMCLRIGDHGSQWDVAFCITIIIVIIIIIIIIIILRVVLYGCETWSPTLMEGCRLRVFENRSLMGVFGLKKDGNGEWIGSTMRNFIVSTVHLI